MPKTFDSLSREGAIAFMKGKKAWEEQLPLNACPFPSGKERMKWIEGFNMGKEISLIKVDLSLKGKELHT